VVIASYNDHVRLLSPSLLVGFAPPKFTRAWEPTLSWNQLHSKPRRASSQYRWFSQNAGRAGLANDD
jgi:hypothetical protein